QVQAAQAANLTVWGTQIVYPVSGHESTFTQVAAGQIHNLALKQDGTVLAWGWNGFGQSSVPAGLSGVVAMAGAYGHSLALKQLLLPTTWSLLYHLLRCVLNI